MRTTHFITATLVATATFLASAPARAEAVFSWGVTAEENTTGVRNYLDGFEDGSFTSGGVQSVTSGGVNATVNAWADPVAGMFKSVTTAQISGGTAPSNIAESYARLDIYDTVNVSGPGSTANLTITLDYDTVFAGLGLSPFPKTEPWHFMQVDSSRGVWVDYKTANPAFDPSAACTGSGESLFCPNEAIEFFTINDSVSKDLFREWAIGGPAGVYGNGDVNDGRYTGQVTLSMLVPTNVDINLNFQFHTNARCFNLADCALSADASHSDYMGIALDSGYSFTSANGYQYLGVPAAIPEPSTVLLMLAGLVAMGGVVRRRAA